MTSEAKTIKEKKKVFSTTLLRKGIIMLETDGH